MRRRVLLATIFIMLATISVGTLAADGLVMMQDVPISSESFDRIVFNRLNVAAARKKCNDALDASITMVETVTELNESQRRKLELAGQLDIHRFFFRYELAKQEIEFGKIPREQWQQYSLAAQQRIAPLTRRYPNELHNQSSLFYKTLAAVLDPLQYRQVKEKLRPVFSGSQ